MDEHILVHRSDVDIQGQWYRIEVYCRPDGRYFATTAFEEDDDVIVSDGMSLEETLEKHRRLIPLAVLSRQILDEVRPPGKSDSRLS